MHYVIIGGGITGTTAAEQLRKQAPEAQITIISNEPHPLYSRVLLPHYLKGKAPRERVFLKNEDWYREQDITLLYDEVREIRPQDKLVGTASGKQLPYNKLLIAGGGTVNRLELSTTPNAFHLQTIDDADALKAAVTARRDAPTQAHVIGGGFISVELIELFAVSGFTTRVHLRGDRFFSRTFDAESSAILTRHLAEHNVTVCTQTTCTRTKDGQLVQSDASEHTCDILGIGIGLNAAFPWATTAGLEVNRGIVTNEFLETNIEHIYAAGDCAEYHDIVTGRTVQMGNWMNALMQGRYVATSMLGTEKPFRLVSSYATHVLGIDLITIGDARREHADLIIARGDETSRTQFMIEKNRIVGATLIDRNTERAPVTQLIDRKVDITDHKSNLADPAFDLKELL